MKVLVNKSMFRPEPEYRSKRWRTFIVEGKAKVQDQYGRRLLTGRFPHHPYPFNQHLSAVPADMVEKHLG